MGINIGRIKLILALVLHIAIHVLIMVDVQLFLFLFYGVQQCEPNSRVLCLGLELKKMWVFLQECVFCVATEGRRNSSYVKSRGIHIYINILSKMEGLRACCTGLIVF